MQIKNIINPKKLFNYYEWETGVSKSNINLIVSLLSRLNKQFQLNNKKQNPEEYVKVLVEISMSDKEGLARNGGKRFYTKRLKRKNLAPKDMWEQKRAEDSKRRKLLELLKKP